MERYSFLIGNHHGIYVPQVFAENHDIEAWHVSEDDAAILKEGPDHEWYWEAWDDVLHTAYYEQDGRRYSLRIGESGDLFVELEMTDTELAQWVTEYHMDNADEEKREAFISWYEENSDAYDLYDNWDILKALEAFAEDYQKS